MAAPSSGPKDQPDQEKQQKLPPCQVTYIIGEKSYKGTSVCFNESGMLVLCRQPALLNTHVKLVLQFPNISKPFEVDGEVVWTNIHAPDDVITPRGMGVKFFQEDTDLLRSIAQVATQYDSPENVYHCYYS